MSQESAPITPKVEDRPAEDNLWRMSTFDEGRGRPRSVLEVLELVKITHLSKQGGRNVRECPRSRRNTHFPMLPQLGEPLGATRFALNRFNSINCEEENSGSAEDSLTGGSTLSAKIAI